MKAISLWQPWASAIALGLKRCETRHWSTSVRGPLLIHAAKRWTLEQQDFALDMGLGLPLPLGALVATARLVRVFPTSYRAVSEQERAWGDYSPGRFVWILDDIRALPEPIPWLGAQGFFDVPDDALYNARRP